MTSSPGDAARVPALSPGYLPLDRLLILHDTLRDAPHVWADHPGGLAVLRRTVEAELALRGVSTGNPARLDDSAPVTWPELDRDALIEEWRRRTDLREGRIPPPHRLTDLWAQHKYSVMARSPAGAREIGGALGRQDRSLDVETLLPRLVLDLRKPPPAGRLRDAVMHMWGYVSPVARTRGLEPDYEDLAATVGTIAAIALEEPRGYLATSTALSDLVVWGNGAPGEPERGDGEMPDA